MSQIEFDENVARALERMYMTPDVVGQRSDFLRAVALRKGERVLDVGVGVRPDFLVHDMAKIVGEKGRVAGVDARALGESGEYFFSINRYVFGALRAG